MAGGRGPTAVGPRLTYVTDFASLQNVEVGVVGGPRAVARSVPRKFPKSPVALAPARENVSVKLSRIPLMDEMHESAERKAQ